KPDSLRNPDFGVLEGAPKGRDLISIQYTVAPGFFTRCPNRGAGVHWDDVPRQRPAEHTPDDGESPVGGDRSPPVNDSVKERDYILANDVLGLPAAPGGDHVLAEDTLVLGSRALPRARPFFKIGFGELGHAFCRAIGLAALNVAFAGINALPEQFSRIGQFDPCISQPHGGVGAESHPSRAAPGMEKPDPGFDAARRHAEAKSAAFPDLVTFSPWS